MSYLNLMGTTLKPKEVNDTLESLTNSINTPIEIKSDDVEYDNTTSHLSATNVQSAIDEIVPTLSTFVKGSLVNINHVVFSDSETALAISLYTGTDDDNGYYIMFGKINKTLVIYSVTDGTPTLLWSVTGT